MFQSRLTKILKESNNILLCGCGGGYDIYTGMPFYHAYSDKITLASITFADCKLLETVASEKHDNCWIVDYDNSPVQLENTYPNNYVPEYWLSKHLSKQIYAIYPNGVKPLVKLFTEIIREHNIDTVVLIDGGIDSMMFGDEEGIGTFSEDISTMVAISLLPVKKILITNTWGVEGHLSHNRYFENVALLIRQNGFLGSQFLEQDSEEGKFYIDVLHACFPENSTINSCLYASITGHDWKSPHPFLLKRYSSYQPNSDFTLQDWVGCPLGAIYWAFDLDKVISNIVYKDKILNSESIGDVDKTVHHYRYDAKLVDDNGEYIGKRTSTFF